VLSGMPWNCHWAKICFDGKMVICDGRLWMDVTDKVLAEFEKRRVELLARTRKG